MFMFADPDTYTAKKGDDRQGTGETDESGREQILMSYECLGSLQSVVAIGIGRFNLRV